MRSAIMVANTLLVLLKSFKQNADWWVCKRFWFCLILFSRIGQLTDFNQNLYIVVIPGNILGAIIE